MSDILSTMLGVSHLSLVINSSINFLIYFSMGKRFKAATNRFVYQPIPGQQKLQCQIFF
jgi:hypothetical protein